jgi:7-carboxy-7-deazaguanine synthase
MACTFVRLQGCPLRCHYCDTAYAFREGSTFSLDEVVTNVLESNVELVQITGGEPLAQKNCFPLIAQLADHGMTVLVETSGACDMTLCDPRSHLIVDIKTPHSGAANSFLELNYDRLTKNDEVKFVLSNREDFEWAVQRTKEKELRDRVAVVHFSPAMPQCANEEVIGCAGLDPKQLAHWIIEEAPWAHLQLQLHKFIWPPSMRGV